MESPNVFRGSMPISFANHSPTSVTLYAVSLFVVLKLNWRAYVILAAFRLVRTNPTLCDFSNFESKSITKFGIVGTK